MLLMIENGTKDEICHVIYLYVKANGKYMKDYNKNKMLPCLKYWDLNNLYGWVMSKKLSVNDVKWVEKTSEFNEDFLKN